MFSLFNFVLQPSIFDMTARWSEKPAAEKTDLIELEVRLVISRSSQRPWTWVGKLTCCLKSRHVRILLNLLVCPFALFRCKLKSPNLYKLSWSGIIFSRKSWNSSKNWHVPFWSLYRQTTKPLNELFPIRAEIASNVLKDGRGWISVLNWSDTSMPTPPPVRWSARSSWKNE